MPGSLSAGPRLAGHALTEWGPASAQRQATAYVTDRRIEIRESAFFAGRQFVGMDLHRRRSVSTTGTGCLSAGVCGRPLAAEEAVDPGVGDVAVYYAVFSERPLAHEAELL